MQSDVITGTAGTYNFDNDLSEEDMRANARMSRRDRQLLRAYGSGPEENQPVEGEHRRKKSRTSANNRKRKRTKSIRNAMRMEMAGSERGLADAQEQLQQDLNSPDNGCLQLVISRDDERHGGLD